MTRRRAVRLLVALGTAANLGAAAHGAYQPIRFERLSLQEGLSQSTVLTLLQDREGYLWFGTEGGLNRYDGRSFSHYYHDSSAANSLPGNYIYALAEDPHGDLWIATDGGGVARWERRSDRFTSFRHDPADAATPGSDHLRAVHVDDAGGVWLGTRDQGLDLLDPDSSSVTHFRHDPSDPSTLGNDEVYVITSDRAGRLWVGTNGGLNRLDPATGRFVRYRHDPLDAASLAGDRIRSIFEDRRGDLWVGTDRGGLHRLADPESGRFERYRHDPQDPTSLSHDRVRAIFEDAAGRLWVGTAAGLNLLDRERGRFVRYTHDPARLDSLPNNEIMVIRQDRGGVLWIGTKNGGLARWNPRTWSFGHYSVGSSSRDGLSHPVVTSFAVDPAGHLWVGTMGGGLNVLHRATGVWRHYRAGAGGLSDDWVMALLQDHQGRVWVGTRSRGLDVLDPATGGFRRFRSDPADPQTLGADAIMSLFEDRAGNVWVGTFGGGASRYDRRADRFVRIAGDDPDGLASARVTSFAQDPAGMLWVGTDGQGLYLLDGAGHVLAHYVQEREDPAALTGDTIYALHVDSGGDVWIGIRGGWLNRVQGSSQEPQSVTFEHYNARRNGLLDADVYGIESDGEGHLWLSTNRGLTRFHPQRGSVKHYHQHHGLQANEFNFGAHYRSANGELFFGGIQGFNAFSPDGLEENEHAPPAVLRSLEVNNAPVPIPPEGFGAAGIELGYRDPVVTFELAALDFAAPRENRYAFMLEGFDADWVDHGNEPRVTYTNLDAGRYLLRARAANNDGLWGEPLEIPLTVEPAPWETWWAYAAYFAAAALGFAAFVRSQQKKVQREAEYSRKLETEVRERTRELRDRNADLAALNQKLEEASLTDPLTGLRNRRFLFEQVTKDISLVRRRYFEVASGRQDPEVFDLVFMMLDLDHFKSVNDTHGHAAGDRVLLEVRDVLLETCRQSDIIIRWGGDEFLIVARDSDPATAEGLAERLRSRIEDNVVELENGAHARITCSVGFACFPFLRTQPDVLSWDHVIQLADTALYHAKAARNAWVGYLSTTKAETDEALSELDRKSPEELVASGALEVRTSPAAASEPAAAGGGAEIPAPGPDRAESGR